MRRADRSDAAAAGGWFETSLVSPGVTRIVEPFVHSFFRANFYRIEGRDADIQLDFGIGVRSLAPVFADRGKPLLAIATHAHVDHVGGLHEFERRFGHPLEGGIFAAMPDDGTLASWFARLDGALTRLPSPGFAMETYALRPAALTQTLDEGDVVDLGDRRFRVLHLPGHSPGSIALLDEANGEFFSGDAIYDDELVDDIPGADIAVYRATMRRLLDLDFAIGHGGHGEPFDRKRLRGIANAYLDAKGG